MRPLRRHALAALLTAAVLSAPTAAVAAPSVPAEQARGAAPGASASATADRYAVTPATILLGIAAIGLGTAAVGIVVRRARRTAPVDPGHRPLDPQREAGRP